MIPQVYKDMNVTAFGMQEMFKWVGIMDSMRWSWVALKPT